MYPYHRDQKNRDGLVRDILVVHNKFLCDCVSSGQVAASDYFGYASIILLAMTGVLIGFTVSI